MKRYKVQWAYPLEVGAPIIYNFERPAADQVAYLLGTWIYRDLQDLLARGAQYEAPDHPEFFEGLAYLVPQIHELMEAGKVWDAYDLWEDFYLRFEREFGRPLYLKFGAVFVEGSPETGLKNKIPLLKRIGKPRPFKGEEGAIIRVINRRDDKTLAIVHELREALPKEAAMRGVRISMDQFLKAIVAAERALQGKYQSQDVETENAYLAAFRAGVMKRMFPKGGGSLGAMTSWLVQYADFGGASHAGRHTSEERAKQQAGEYLIRLMQHLESHVGMEAIVGRNTEYVESASALMERLHYLLSDDMVWRAYLEYKAFEEEWSAHFNPIPLEMSIGTMRVIPRPEPEPEGKTD